MTSTIPGGDILSGALAVIAQSLLLPVMILLIIFVIFAIFELGSVIAEYTSRKKVTAQQKSELIEKITASETKTEICDNINRSGFSKSDKKLLCEIAGIDTEKYDKQAREILSRNLLEDQENKAISALEKDEIVSKIGSACGLLGTIIPMGPGLAALGAGDLITLTSNLTVAFNTTTAGLAAGSLCFVILKIRSKWYRKDMNDLYDIAEIILEVE